MTTPTGSQIVSYAMTFRGKAKGRVRENVNDFTQWYYGDNTAASWCMIFVCHTYNHFDSLGLLNGKIAYVPNLKSHVGSKWHTSKDGIAAGDPVTFDFNRSGEPEHVGLFIKWLDKSSGTFQSIEGNTGDDLVATRTRDWSDVFGYVKPGLAPEDPSKYPGVVYSYAKGKHLQSGTHVKWIQERLGLTGKALDGQYGPKTASKVKSFQASHGLTKDGQVGPKTWAALAK